MRKRSRAELEMGTCGLRTLNTWDLPRVAEIMICTPEPRTASVSFSNPPALFSLCKTFHILEDCLSHELGCKPYLPYSHLPPGFNPWPKAVAPKTNSGIATASQLCSSSPSVHTAICLAIWGLANRSQRIEHGALLGTRVPSSIKIDQWGSPWLGVQSMIS